jgi:hypothetical protein
MKCQAKHLYPNAKQKAAKDVDITVKYSGKKYGNGDVPIRQCN